MNYFFFMACFYVRFCMHSNTNPWIQVAGTLFGRLCSPSRYPRWSSTLHQCTAQLVLHCFYNHPRVERFHYCNGRQLLVCLDNERLVNSTSTKINYAIVYQLLTFAHDSYHVDAIGVNSAVLISGTTIRKLDCIGGTAVSIDNDWCSKAIFVTTEERQFTCRVPYSETDKNTYTVALTTKVEITESEQCRILSLSRSVQQKYSFTSTEWPLLASKRA